MHDLIDTDELDASAERYWPEGFKGVIRGALVNEVHLWLLYENAFKDLWRRHYKEKFKGHEGFCRRLAEIIGIGAENGCDEAWEELFELLKRQGPLPPQRLYAQNCLPMERLEPIHRKIVEEVVNEYAREHLFADHLFEDYRDQYPDLGSFLGAIGGAVADGALRGAEDAMGRIARSLRLGLPLPPARRRPRRLKRL